jgi:hypothetical protein
VSAPPDGESVPFEGDAAELMMVAVSIAVIKQMAATSINLKRKLCDIKCVACALAVFRSASMDRLLDVFVSLEAMRNRSMLIKNNFEMRLALIVNRLRLFQERLEF